MTFFRALQIGTVGLGFIAVFLSFALFMHFWRSPRKISKAVGLMLLGESIGACVTVIFAMGADGLTDVIGPKSAIVLRIVLFSAAMVTSLHLAYRIWMIEIGEEE